ncbi:Cell cycle serine/threonine-protein kinase cdc5/MSD2 [Massospora cicadina]|nr:Cell cycle serine/threonine-protein kinase cdc5/MSD2 [Massospora cicadina]
MGAPLPNLQCHTSVAPAPTEPACKNRTVLGLEPPFPKVLYDTRRGKTFVCVKPLGKGGFAKCYLVKDSVTEANLCCKAIWKPSLRCRQDKERTRSEVKILKRLDHPNIVKYYHACEDGDFVYILMELCERKSLKDLLERRKILTEPEARYYLLQLLDVLEYLMSKRVIHRDLKLANIFLSKDMTIRVGDFGLSGELTDEETRKMTMCGTPNYIAPEVIFDKQGYNYAVDMWALGIILYSLLVGTPPFYTKEGPEGIYSKIKRMDIHYPETSNLSKEARSAIDMILKSKPGIRPRKRLKLDERPSFQQVRHHPFFQGFTPTSLPPTAYHQAPDYSNQLKRPHEHQVPDYANHLKRAHEGGEGAGSKISPRSLRLCPRQTKHRQRPKDIAPHDVGQLFHAIVQTFREMSGLIAAGATVEEVEAKFGPTNFTLPNFVNKWTDHGNQYGFGYVLADTTAGVLFKDSSTILVAPDRRNYEYVGIPLPGKFHSIHFTDATLPPALVKKQTLVLKFLEHMDSHVAGAIQPELAKELLPPLLHSPLPFIPLADPKGDDYHPPQLPHLTKYSSTTAAKIFRGSANFVQMNVVKGDAKVILSDGGKAVFFIPRRGEAIQSFRLSDILYNHHTQDADPLNQYLYKTLIYFKSILVHFTTKGLNPAAAGSGAQPVEN